MVRPGDSRDFPIRVSDDSDEDCGGPVRRIRSHHQSRKAAEPYGSEAIPYWHLPDPPGFGDDPEEPQRPCSAPPGAASISNVPEPAQEPRCTSAPPSLPQQLESLFDDLQLDGGDFMDSLKAVTQLDEYLPAAVDLSDEELAKHGIELLDGFQAIDPHEGWGSPELHI